MAAFLPKGLVFACFIDSSWRDNAEAATLGQLKQGCLDMFPVGWRGQRYICSCSRPDSNADVCVQVQHLAAVGHASAVPVREITSTRSQTTRYTRCFYCFFFLICLSHVSTLHCFPPFSFHRNPMSLDVQGGSVSCESHPWSSLPDTQCTERGSGTTS